MQKNLPAGSADTRSELEAPQRRQLLKGAALASLSGGLLASTATSTAAGQPAKATTLDAKLKQHIQNVVIIYLETVALIICSPISRVWKNRCQV